MGCKKCCGKEKCSCVNNHGIYDVKRLKIDGSSRTELNWTETTITEVLRIPDKKPDIESADELYACAEINCIKLVETPFAYKSYGRLVSDNEILMTNNTIKIIKFVSIDSINETADIIMSNPLLPSVPSVELFNEALKIVNTIFNTLSDDVEEAEKLILISQCLLAEELKKILQKIYKDLLSLQDAANELIQAFNFMLSDISGIIPIEDINNFIAAINSTLTQIDTAITAIIANLSAIENVRYFEVIPNEEGTTLTGRKLIIEGTINIKLVYTGISAAQTIYSAHYRIPFSAYIIPYAKFQGLQYKEDIVVVTDEEKCTIKAINGFGYNPEVPIIVDLYEEFLVNCYIEDIFKCTLNRREIFNYVVLFLKARPTNSCV